MLEKPIKRHSFFKDPKITYGIFENDSSLLHYLEDKRSCKSEPSTPVIIETSQSLHISKTFEPSSPSLYSSSVPSTTVATAASDVGNDGVSEASENEVAEDGDGE